MREINFMNILIFRLPNAMMKFDEFYLMIKIYAGHNDYAYILNEAFADMAITELHKKNKAHLFHRIETPIGMIDFKKALNNNMI